MVATASAFFKALNESTQAKISGDPDQAAECRNLAFQILDQIGEVQGWDVFKHNRKVRTLASYEAARAWVYAQSAGEVDPDSWAYRGGLHTPINGAPYAITLTHYRP